MTKPQAPPRSCSGIRPPSKEPCGAPVTRRVRFADDTTALVCEECALALMHTAESVHTRVGVERIK